MSAFLLSLREGLEAALIVGILLGALQRLGRRELGRQLWLGVAAAVVVSVGVAAILAAAGVKFEGRTEEIFEGVTLILAAGFLTGMIFWMRRQGTQLRGHLEAQMRRAAASNQMGRWSVFTVAFLAVVREGVELTLLLAATAFQVSVGTTLIGAALGLLAAVALGGLFFAGVVRLDLRRVFAVTNVLLLIFAAGMVGLGVHELIEAALVPAVIDPVWNINAILSDKSTIGELLKGLFGYNGNPALTEIIAYCGYLLIVGWALFRPARATR